MISLFAAHIVTRTRKSEGQDLLEYALLTALIVVVAVGAVSSVGETIRAVLWEYIQGAAGDI